MIKFNKRYFNSNTYASVSFSKFSQYWWANRYYSLIVRQHVLTGGKLLDIGCGLGHFLRTLEDNYKTTGIEVNAWALRQARKNAPSSQLRKMGAENVNKFPMEYFDVIVIKHVVEHLKNPVSVIRKIVKILKHNGHLLLITPNPKNLLRPLKGNNWIGLLDPTHISLKGPEEWIGAIRSADLQIEKVWSDGFWNTPYVPLIPTAIQKIIFGIPGGIQAIFGLSFIPVNLGESIIILARKATHNIQ